jgi:diadenosine tetraphosphate (Ap4A) HIT family hydrolase
MTFALHPRLGQDTSLVGELPLCTVLLNRDDSVPWIILVPKVDNIKEIHQLSIEQQQQLLLESQLISQMLEHLFLPDKLNLGSLGNIVPQLHLHHIARFVSDIAWPGPLWGNAAGQYRNDSEQSTLVNKIRGELKKNHSFQCA